MTGKSLAQLLGIAGWKLTGEPLFSEEEGRAQAMVEIVREKTEYECPCGRWFKSYYDGDFREVRDVSWGKWDWFLLFYQVRVDCPDCGVRTERLEWLASGQRYFHLYWDRNLTSIW